MGEKAIGYAKETLKLTEEHDFKGFDLAYAYESIARANAALNYTEECKKWYEKAGEAGELIEGTEDKKLFMSDLENGPWFDCR